MSQFQKSKLVKTNKYKPTQKVDELNLWSYCNPDNIVDPLPQPYRFIDEYLQENILKPVYTRIFEIEKYKNDPNYEGQMKSLPPQGSFDISNTTAIGKDSSQHLTTNHVITGDSLGNIVILDLNKKMRVAKKELGNGKRVTKIEVQGRDHSTDDYANVQNYYICIISKQYCCNVAQSSTDFNLSIQDW